MANLTINKTDSSVITATPTINLRSFIDSSDFVESTAVSDTPTVFITTLFISVSDLSTVSDTIVPKVVIFLNVTDSTVISDAPQVMRPPTDMEIVQLSFRSNYVLQLGWQTTSYILQPRDWQ